MFLSTIALLLLITAILFWRQCAAYNHRNKLPPGPLPLPIIGNLHLLGNLPHRALHKLSQKYGPIMSIRLGAVQSVVVSSPEAAKLFVGTHDAVFASRPKIQASEYLSYGSKGMAFTEYGPYWRSVRKFCTLELLTVAKINGFAEMRREEIGLMVAEIRRAATAREVMNLSESVGGFIEGVTCRMVFGKKNDSRFVFKNLIDELMAATGAFNLGDYVPLLAPFDVQGLTRRLKKISKDVDQMLETLIGEHEEQNLVGVRKHDEMDFIDILISLKDRYSNTHDDLSYTIDRSSMKAILLDIIAASIDTTKTSIEWILSVLIKHPRVMKEVKKQLNMVVGDKQQVDEKDLSKLTYLDMVIKETFRLYPVVPLLVPHESIQDVVINGYKIPKKTRVFINFWAFGRDPMVWSNNWEDFVPERFVDKEIDFRSSGFELMHFGVGRRGCPGLNLGLLNVGLAVSNIIHCFDWELPNGSSPCDLDMKEKFGLTTPRDSPLLAIPTYRPYGRRAQI